MERIDKIISSQGKYSRSEIKKLASQGRIKINDNIVKKVNEKIDIETSTIYIDNEKLVKENNIIYTIISFKKGYKRYTKKEIEYGPVLLKNKDELFNELLINKISKNNYVINKLPKNKLFKKISLKINNYNLKKEMIQM